MSFAGIHASGGNDPPQQYFCYQCERTVTITPCPSSDLLCPHCNGGFLEEYENPNPASNPIPNFDADPFSGFPDHFSPLIGGLPFLLSAPSPDAQNPSNSSRFFSVEPDMELAGGYPQDPNAFNPFAFLRHYIEAMRAGGANIQFVVENNPSDQGFRLPANMGDYFVGPGLEQLIQQLAENDPNRYGTPPASKSAVQALPDVSVTAELLVSDLSQCAVCMNEFGLGMKVKQMPCNHIFHSECLLPWLHLHNSCPVCRHELPTDDSDYENRMQGVRGSGSSNVVAGGGSQENAQTPRTANRRFTISLPWPFSFGSRAETSDGGGGNSGGNSGSETRHGD